MVNTDGTILRAERFSCITCLSLVTIEKKDKEGMEEKTIKKEKWKLSQLAEL